MTDMHAGAPDPQIDDRLIEAWRLSIEHAKIPLGVFNWPWALRLALDEIERLRTDVDRLAVAIHTAIGWIYVANPDPERNGDLFGELRAILEGTGA